MAMKHRVPRYDTGVDNATRPDIVTGVNDWDEDWSRSVELDERRAQELRPYGALVEPPPRWNEPTIPDLPLRVSMAAPSPSEPPAPKETAIPRSGPRHRAVPAPAAPPMPPLMHALPPDEPAARAFVASNRKRGVSLRAPLVAALTGFAAAVGASLGNGSVASWLARIESSAARGAVAGPVTAKSSAARAPSLTTPRLPAPADAPSVPVVRFEDLPLTPASAPDGDAQRAASSERRTGVKRRRP